MFPAGRPTHHRTVTGGSPASGGRLPAASPQDAGAQTVVGWATAISPGAADEAGQTLTFNVSNDNNGLFAAQPALAANGTLTYTPNAAGNSGSYTYTLDDANATASS